MKSNFYGMTSKGKKMSEAEFHSLRSEMDMRVGMAFTHGFSVVSISLVFFAAIFVFISGFIDFTLKENAVTGQAAFIDCFITLGIEFLCLIPALIMIPYGYKYRDNIRVITNIGAYIKVFYDFPTLKDNSGKENLLNYSEVYGWELLHCDSKIPDGKKFSTEYNLVSIISLAMASVFAIVLFFCTIYFHNYFEKALDGAIVIIAIIISVIMIVGLAVIAFLKRKNTDTSKLFECFAADYFEYYIELAENLGVLTNEEVNELCAYNSEINK